jgi:hypothetical protein
MAKDPTVLAHQEWLGYVQPTGLVVSIPAMIDAGAVINRNFGPDHQRFLSSLPQDASGEVIPEIPDFVAFAQEVLGWDPSFLLGAPGSDPVPKEFEVTLENYNETLCPTYVLRDLEHVKKPLMFINVLSKVASLDEVFAPHDRGWQASQQARFERLLRQTGVPTGLLVNGREIRVVYAPEKELSGHITFKVAEMAQVAGRPIFAALQMLIGSERLYSVADNERLPAILANSRKYQNVVSTQLAEQVLEALYELLRGFQAANDQSKGELLRSILERDPDHVYHGLLTTLLRLVFILYAEDRGLLSTDPIYSNYYSVTGLHERLRADDGRYKDTMDQRYGAWAQLLSLFRLIYSGGSHGALKIPPREGYLFDADRYLFLEGRHDKKDKPVIPQVSDGVVFRVLSKLLLLDGERLSYRTLAVEQIGSVYQAIMGFSLRVATGRSIAIKAAKKHGAPATIDLEELLRAPGEKRPKKFTEETDQKLTGNDADALKSAKSIEDLLAAVDRKIASTVTPLPVEKGAMVFQPSDERRKSGSHYTPSSLTGPIVEAALEPVLKQLGPKATPTQILNLKVCDPAMGSAAFLVEACRQLGDELVEAWHAHGEIPVLPPDEDEALYAQRVVAQRCLYGLDRNPMAADLAKLSLWLATLAKDHPFTFLDHTLRHGDALVGLTRKQIGAFNWSDSAQRPLFKGEIPKRIERAGQYRQRILDARENVSYAQLAQELAVADGVLDFPRMIGDAAIAAFFSAEKPKQREEARKRLEQQVETDLKQHGFIAVDGEVEHAIKYLQADPKGVQPFHWELEFPEVFTSDDKGNITGGFDVIVGNPPFAGMVTLVTSNRDGYLEWLQQLHPHSHGNADLVAHFFRLAFTLLRSTGCAGLIATNTIAQGDTRASGLGFICKHGGTIYRAVKRLKWPGEAAVVVSVLNFSKSPIPPPYLLNNRQVERITAYLLRTGGSDEVAQLRANNGKIITGVRVLGMGFTFDDDDKKGIASPLSEMEQIFKSDPRCRSRVFPFIGGEEVNNSPEHAARRFIINFEDWPLKRADLGTSWSKASEDVRRDFLRSGIVPEDYPESVAADYPLLVKVVQERVKPERDRDNRPARRLNWWKYGEVAPGYFEGTRKMQRMLVNSQTSPHITFAFVPSTNVCAHSLNIVLMDGYSPFAILQSRVHETWARVFGSSMKDDVRYTATDCFGTFAFPDGFENDAQLESIGRRYYEFRAGVMKQHDTGLTSIYNLFHDPNCEVPEIAELRSLHDALDKAVLHAYGWDDLHSTCEYFPEFEEAEDDEAIGRGQRKQRFRYRWPDETRDDLLARLITLNRESARHEGQLVSEVLNGSPTKAVGKKRSAKAAGEDAPLFAGEKGDE